MPAASTSSPPLSTAHGITPPVADSGELADPEPAVAGVELLGVEPPGVAPPGVEPPGVAPPGVESVGVGVGPVGATVTVDHRGPPNIPAIRDSAPPLAAEITGAIGPRYAR